MSDISDWEILDSTDLAVASIRRITIVGGFFGRIIKRIGAVIKCVGETVEEVGNGIDNSMGDATKACEKYINGKIKKRDS